MFLSLLPARRAGAQDSGFVLLGGGGEPLPDAGALAATQPNSWESSLPQQLVPGASLSPSAGRRQVKPCSARAPPEGPARPLLSRDGSRHLLLRAQHPVLPSSHPVTKGRIPVGRYGVEVLLQGPKAGFGTQVSCTHGCGPSILTLTCPFCPGEVFGAFSFCGFAPT